MDTLKRIAAFFYKRSDIWIKGVCYMRRWRFLPDWLPGIRVHNILQSDDDRALHDHPFSFVTVILRGGYWEYLADGSRTWHGAPSVLFRQALTLHRIELQKIWLCPHTSGDSCGCPAEEPKLRPAWTLVFRTRYYRDWGFQTKAGWVHNRQFIDKREGNHYDNGKAK